MYYVFIPLRLSSAMCCVCSHSINMTLQPRALWHPSLLTAVHEFSRPKYWVKLQFPSLGICRPEIKRSGLLHCWLDLLCHLPQMSWHPLKCGYRFNPLVGESPLGKWQPTQYYWKIRGWRNLISYSPGGRNSDTTEQLLLPSELLPQGSPMGLIK